MNSEQLSYSLNRKQDFTVTFTDKGKGKGKGWGPWLAIALKQDNNKYED